MLRIAFISNQSQTYFSVSSFLFTVITLFATLIGAFWRRGFMSWVTAILLAAPHRKWLFGNKDVILGCTVKSLISSPLHKARFAIKMIPLVQSIISSRQLQCQLVCLAWSRGQKPLQDQYNCLQWRQLYCCQPKTPRVKNGICWEHFSWALQAESGQWVQETLGHLAAAGWKLQSQQEEVNGESEPLMLWLHFMRTYLLCEINNISLSVASAFAVLPMYE